MPSPPLNTRPSIQMAIRDLPFAAMVLTGIAAAVLYGSMKLIQTRMFYRDLPKPPHSFLYGHLKLVGKTFAMLPGGSHFQVVATTIARKHDMPGVFYLDMWPASWGLIVVTDPDVVLHMTVARNHPKHEAEGLILDPIVGSRNIVSANGPLWKHLHKMLAPAFAISHITNMRPMVAAEVMTFRSMLSKKAETGQVFRLQDLAEYLAFDVIHTATFGFSADAQTQGSAVLEHFDDMCRADMRSKKSWNLVRNIFARRTRDAARKKLDPIIVDLIKERLNNVRRDNLDLSNKRGIGIIDLILKDYLNEHQQAGRDDLDPQFLKDAVTQVKTMLVAGTATTADSVSFGAMLLSNYPEVVQKMRMEHDRVFAPGIDATYEILKTDPHRLNELVYTTDVIKEVLRLYPIGHTIRGGIDSITYQGRELPTKGLMVFLPSLATHMDPKNFPDPGKFDPDRYTRGDSPRHAWRPFEKGPRACLGQPLAMDELLLTLLLTVRDFDFTCADLKPNKTPRVEWMDLDLTFGDRAFQEEVFEAKPRDGMPMTVKKSNWSSQV